MGQRTVSSFRIPEVDTIWSWLDVKCRMGLLSHYGKLILSVLDCLPNALVNTILMNSLVTLLLVIVYIILGFYVGLTTYSGMARNDSKSLNMVLFQSCCNDFCLCSQHA